MSEHKHLQLTQSHLLRRLLQRRVETLEDEKFQMRERITQLEQRLQNSTQRHAAITGDGIKEVMDQAIADVRGLGERAQAEADFTLNMTHPKQEKLLDEMKRLHEESTKLNRMLTDMMEGIRAIEEQAKTSSALLLKEASHQQEKLTGELEGLYDEKGNLRVAIVDARQNALQVQKRAQTERSRLNGEAIQERERLLAQIDSLHKESQKLHVAMNQAAESAYTISRWTQVETANALQAQSSQDILAHTPSFVPQNGGSSNGKSSIPVGEDLILEAAREAIANGQKNGSLGPSQPVSSAAAAVAKNKNGNGNHSSKPGVTPVPTNMAQSATNVETPPSTSPKLILFQRVLMAILLCLVIVLVYNIVI